MCGDNAGRYHTWHPVKTGGSAASLIVVWACSCGVFKTTTLEIEGVELKVTFERLNGDG